MRVAIAEDAILLREGLIRLLTENDCEIVAEPGMAQCRPRALRNPETTRLADDDDRWLDRRIAVVILLVLVRRGQLCFQNGYDFLDMHAHLLARPLGISLPKRAENA